MREKVSRSRLRLLITPIALLALGAAVAWSASLAMRPSGVLEDNIVIASDALRAAGHGSVGVETASNCGDDIAGATVNVQPNVNTVKAHVDMSVAKPEGSSTAQHAQEYGGAAAGLDAGKTDGGQSTDSAALSSSSGTMGRGMVIAAGGKFINRAMAMILTLRLKVCVCLCQLRMRTHALPVHAFIQELCRASCVRFRSFAFEP